MEKKVGTWGGSRSVRLDLELKTLGVDSGEMVEVLLHGREIVIKPVKAAKEVKKK